MWKVIRASVAGTSHAQSGQPCQDHCGSAIIDVESHRFLVVACSDGAGSASLAQVGSNCAVESFLATVSKWIVAAESPRPPDADAIKLWVDACRALVLDAAEANGATPRELACTLLGAVVGRDWAAFCQIGDGAIVFDSVEGYAVAFWPENGEYANATYFLTDEDYHEHVRTEVLETQIDELAGLTDGLQMLALDYANSRPHERFFAPLFKALSRRIESTALQSELEEFLSSDRINTRTDDDKTLVLAKFISEPCANEPTP